MRRAWRTAAVVAFMIAGAAVLPPSGASAAGSAGSVCSQLLRPAHVAGPGKAVAWRAGVESRTAVLSHLPGRSMRASSWLAPTDAPWVLVLSRPRAADGRCWVQIRLPWRPNAATGWVNASKVFLEQTRWRIAVSTARRRLTLFRFGVAVRSLSVVVGKPSTPTPTGLFAIAWAIPWHPTDFLGSWVLELTAHSNVLQEFDGGDGTVGIHGRGGASLLDPLGTAASHGCIRLANADIDWLVRTVGAAELPGTAVQVN